MAEAEIKPAVSNESLNKVIALIDAGKSFVLEAGAGSGKTWALVESLKHVLDRNSDALRKNNRRIVCITYTNVAADQIEDRIEKNPLVAVSTIHSFLWDVIKNYQIELRQEVINYNLNESKKPIDNLEDILREVPIDYSLYGRNLEQGKITHDDVIRFAGKLFGKYNKILRITADKYPFIFVDEYQDTQPETTALLLDNLLEAHSEKVVIGFYGDSMQKIYNQGVGKITHDRLQTVTKPENFRCSTKVIDLLNKIRPSLKQYGAGDNVVGEISFYHNNNSTNSSNEDYQEVIKQLEEHNWSFDPSKTKILMLTHRGIAGKLDYPNLLKAYSILPFGRERLYEREEVFSELLIDKIEKLIQLYIESRYGEFLKLWGVEGVKIRKHADKRTLKNHIDKLVALRAEKTIKEVMEYVFDHKLLFKSTRISEFQDLIQQDQSNDTDTDTDSDKIEKKREFYNALMQIRYQEVVNLNSYIQEFTPFSTKHGVKGAEYENVLVVIDDTSWNQYKFNDVFGNNRANQNRFDRTLNLLYVCCSRAKDKLAVLSLSKMDSNAMSTIENWFGQENIFEVS